MHVRKRRNLILVVVRVGGARVVQGGPAEVVADFCALDVEGLADCTLLRVPLDECAAVWLHIGLEVERIAVGIRVGRGCRAIGASLKSLGQRVLLVTTGSDIMGDILGGRRVRNVVVKGSVSFKGFIHLIFTLLGLRILVAQQSRWVRHRRDRWESRRQRVFLSALRLGIDGERHG